MISSTALDFHHANNNNSESNNDDDENAINNSTQHIESNDENSQYLINDQELYIIEPITRVSERLFSISERTDEDDYIYATLLQDFEEENVELVYGDEIRMVNGVKYRIWNDDASFLPHCLDNGEFVIRKGCKIMCLEALPIEVSYISEIVESSGKVYALYRSTTLYESCVKLSQKRTNIIPIQCRSRFYDLSENQSLINESHIDSFYLNTKVSYSMDILQLISQNYIKIDTLSSFSVLFNIPDGYYEPNIEYLREYCINHVTKTQLVGCSFILYTNCIGLTGQIKRFENLD